MYIYNKNISYDLSKHGCRQAKTFSVAFPYFIDEKYYNHFIRGVFDGDGSICLTTLKTGEHKTMFSIVGFRPFMKEINNIIAKECGLNINQLISYKGKDERIATVGFTGCRQCIKIRDYLYNNATIYLERKHNTFMKLGTDEWRTYQNFNKMKYNNEVIDLCCKCNKDLLRKNKIYEDAIGNKYCYLCYIKSLPNSQKKTDNNIICKNNISVLKIKNQMIYFDTEDLEKVNQYKWHIENGRVVSRQKKPKKCFYMNRIIVGAKDGESVKFTDGNCFNMRKNNLEKRKHR